MQSPGIDKWIEKHPEWWSKQAEDATTQEKVNIFDFKKLLKKGLKNIKKADYYKYLNKKNIEKIFKESKFGNITTTGKGKTPSPKKPKKITIKRKGKTYTRTIQPKWNENNSLGLKIASQAKPRSKEYNEYVKLIMESTGRTRQAVVKKIQRVRKQNKKTIKSKG